MIAFHNQASDAARQVGDEPWVVVKDLVVRYGDFVAVGGVSLEVSSGQILGIVGPNGAGKTSLVECIEGLRQRHSGSVRVAGLDPITDRVALTRLIGVQLQATSYPSRCRVSEVCKLFSGFYHDAVSYQELLVECGLRGKDRQYVSKLSGGEAQKLSLVLALLGRPRVLFLDELTTGLDPNARRSTWELIVRLRKTGCAIVLTSHYMDEVEYLADRVIVMTHGQVKASGTVAQIVASSGGIDKYFLDGGLSDTVSIGRLRNLGGVSDVSETARGVVVRGTYPGALDAVRAYLRDLGSDGSAVQHRAPTLEDAFIELTGGGDDGVGGDDG